MDLLEVLEQSRALGFLGPGPVERHLDHAAAFVAALAPPPARVLDLGAGGGVPGLVLALRWPDADLCLLDASARRTSFLSLAVAELGLATRVAVVTARAEVAGRDPELRGRFDAVVARSFGPPAVTAECGAPFLRPGGWLLVAEPPDPEPARWPASGLAEFGLVDEGVVATGAGTVRRLRASEAAPERYPRPDGVPATRPRF